MIKHIYIHIYLELPAGPRNSLLFIRNIMCKNQMFIFLHTDSLQHFEKQAVKEKNIFRIEKKQQQQPVLTRFLFCLMKHK